MIHVPSLFLARHSPVAALAERSDRCKAKPLGRGYAFSPHKSERRGWFCYRSAVSVFARFQSCKLFRACNARRVEDTHIRGTRTVRSNAEGEAERFSLANGANGCPIPYRKSRCGTLPAMKSKRAASEIVLRCTCATEIRAAGEVPSMRGASLRQIPTLILLREMMCQYSPVMEFN